MRVIWFNLNAAFDSTGPSPSDNRICPKYKVTLCEWRAREEGRRVMVQEWGRGLLKKESMIFKKRVAAETNEVRVHPNFWVTQHSSDVLVLLWVDSHFFGK